jgi:acetolactate synthase-1/2/3 large subunit
MVRQWQELHYEGRYSHSYSEALPDFVALARAFGWQARRVVDPAQLDGAVAACLDGEGPYLLDVRVEQAENCFPMIPAGRGHHEILLAKDRWYEA